MSLEDDAHNFGNSELQVIFVVVLLLNDFKVIFINLLIFIFRCFILGQLVVLLDSVIRFVIHVDKELSESVNSFLSKEALTNLVEDFLGSLNLADESISLSLLVNGLKQVLKIDLAHVLEHNSCSRIGVLNALNESWKCSSN